MDLEIFKDNDMKTQNSVFKKINNTSTLFGESYYINALQHPTTNIKEIKLKQNYIKNIIDNELLYTNIDVNLNKLQNIESDILWFWQEREDHINSLFDLVYFNFPNLNIINNYLNNDEIIMSVVNWYKMAINPLSAIFTPILSILIPLILLKFYNVKISLKSFIDILIKKCISFDKFEQVFGKNIFSKMIAFSSAVIYLIFYVHTSYNSVKMSANINKFINILHTKLNLISNVIDKTDQIIYYCKNYKNELILSYEFDNLTTVINSFKTLFTDLIFKSEPKFINHKGLILSTFKKFIKQKDDMLLIIKFIGKIDLYFSLSKLIKNYDKFNNKICFTEFVEKSKKPILKINKIWHPYLNDSPVQNNIELSKDKGRNMLITGPNAAGKSTFIKTVAINILLSQH